MLELILQIACIVYLIGAVVLLIAGHNNYSEIKRRKENEK